MGPIRDYPRIQVVLRIAMFRIILISIALLATPTIVFAQIESQTEALDSYRHALSILVEFSQRMTIDNLTAEIIQLKHAMAKLEP